MRYFSGAKVNKKRSLTKNPKKKTQKVRKMSVESQSVRAWNGGVAIKKVKKKGRKFGFAKKVVYICSPKREVNLRSVELGM